MTQSGRVIPSSADVPTLTLAAATLIASEVPQARTPDEQHVLADKAVDLVLVLWDEIALRIAAAALLQPAAQPVTSEAQP